MILEFKVSNYLSYYEETLFSMVATREQANGERMASVKQERVSRVNPVAGIYGANASGKSNLAAAIQNWRALVRGAQVGAVGDQFFKLAQDAKTQPVRFQIHFLYQECIYVHGIAVRGARVVEEYLYQVRGKSEEMIFERDELGVEFARDDDQILDTIRENLRHTESLAFRLGMSLGKSQGYEELCVPYNFAIRVVSISPSVEELILPVYHLAGAGDFNKALAALDTGISRFEFVRVDNTETLISSSDCEILDDDNPRACAFMIRGKSLYLLRKEDDGVCAEKVMFIHFGVDGEYALEWGDQSDGTRKIFCILPFLWALMDNSLPVDVLIVDEIDQSLHTDLVAQLVRAFLSRCTHQSRSQLLFSAHDLMLMNLDYLRRDEIWICEKELSGQSRLIRLSEYVGIRNDKDIRKSYLQGRFGGIPEINTKKLAEALTMSRGNDGESHGSLNG